MSAPKRVVVSGASGFLGGHIVNTLLEEGYSVRALARGAKASLLQQAYANYGERFDVHEIADISHDQFPQVFEGIDALIHSASPLPGHSSPEDTFKGAVDGSLNILKQAEKAGVKKIVVTSSIATVRNPNNTYTDKDWNPITKEHAIASGNSFAVYGASKKYAELAVWEWADAHPHVDVTTINPPFLYGAITPQLRSIVASKLDYSAISTDRQIYNLLFPGGTHSKSFTYADVQDVAKLHVKALTSSPSEAGRRKRVIFFSPHIIDWNYSVDLIREKRPELQNRLITASADAPHPFPEVDYERIEQLLGVKKSDLAPLEKTVLSAVDDLLDLEKKWKSAGFDIPTPPPVA